MRLLLVILAFFGLTLAQQIAFQSNVSLSNQNEFKFRSLNTAEFSIPPLYSGVFLSSLGVDVNGGSANVDGLYGAAYTGLANPGQAPIPPSAYLAFFESSTNWKVNGNDYGNASSENSAGFIGKTYLSLEEVSAGSVVASLNLNSLLWSIEDKNLGAGGLRFATFKGIKVSQILNPTFIIRITFAFSDVVGVLNVVGSGVVTPKSVESIVKIDGWPYVANTNSLRLNLAIGSAQAQVQVVGEAQTLTAGSGNNGVWFTLDSKASADGQVTPAEVSGFVDGNADLNFGNPMLAGQVKAKYGASASFKLVSVTFAPGAKEIIYDPGMGAGSNPPSVSSAGMLTPALLLFSLIAKIFFL